MANFWRVLEFDKFAGEWPLLNPVSNVSSPGKRVGECRSNVSSPGKVVGECRANVSSPGKRVGECRANVSSPAIMAKMGILASTQICQIR